MKSKLKELIDLTKGYTVDLKNKGVKEIETYCDISKSAKKSHNKNSNKKIGTNLSLQDYYSKIKNCKKCVLSKTRNNFVFGDGSTKAKLVFVGEAPGFEEDKQGKPFVGRAGKLLTKIIEAIGLKREDVYICNVLKCRPPANRSPQSEEVSLCLPYLKKQLELLGSKKVICALGLFASQALLELKLPMYEMRGKWHEYKGTPVMVTYHPAYLLRNPPEKRKVWTDMKKVKECLLK